MDSGEIGALCLVIASIILSNFLGSLQLGLDSLRITRPVDQQTPLIASIEILLNNYSSLSLCLRLFRSLFGATAILLVLRWISIDQTHWSMTLVLILALGFALISLPRVVLGTTTLPERIVIKATPFLRIFLCLPIPDAISTSWLTTRILGYGALPKPEIDQQIVIPVDKQANPPDEHDLRMIQAILRMENTTAREIMIPRVDVVALESDQEPSVAASRLAESGHSRVPVYRETMDTVLGILYARDLLSIMAKDGSVSDISGLLRPVHFIPESQRVDELLTEFLAEQRQMAIVVDEYGGTQGVVTLEDILEEIVGEIANEFAHEEPVIQTVTPSETIFEARAPIEYLTDRYGVTLEADGFDTVGGFVYRLLGRLPNPGDRISYEGLELEIVTMLGKRIKKIRVIQSDIPSS